MSEETKRQCPVCHTGVLEEGTTTSTFTRESTTLVVKDVPALVCDTCGEAYTTDDVTQRLLEQAERAHKEGVEVDVRRYSDEALQPTRS